MINTSCKTEYISVSILELYLCYRHKTPLPKAQTCKTIKSCYSIRYDSEPRKVPMECPPAGLDNTTLDSRPFFNN